MNATFLAIGDVHLGRRPTRLSREELDELRLTPAQLSPAEGWRRSIDLALSERVHAVLLTGDLVESMADRFEAVGELARGLRRLDDAAIPIYAVAGNHDLEALPRLKRMLPGLNVLGADGEWELVKLTNPPFPVQLVGRSFVAASASQSAMASYDLPHDPSIPSLGLLHADLDASSGTYAPTPRTELTAAHLTAWLLGHTHRPDALSQDAPIGYLGSLVGLDPGEPGPHGPWIVTVSPSGEIDFSHRPLAPLRWQHIDVDVSDDTIRSVEDLNDAAATRIRNAANALCEKLPTPRPDLVALRVKLTGVLEGSGRLDKESLSELVGHVGDTVWLIETLVDDSRAPLNIDELARTTSPPAVLATALQGLARDKEQHDLAKKVSHELRAHFTRQRWPEAIAKHWSALSWSQQQELITREAHTLLERLVAQQEEQP